MAKELRFGFGDNWKHYLDSIGRHNLDAAQTSIANRYGPDGLAGKRFLDAGSGSGVFSRAAALMGANVVSFDFDAASVACTRALQRQLPGHPWEVSQGSLLDEAFMTSLGTFDVVYCWGVAHHIGEMWRALENLARRATGDIIISIYNDQGKPSKRWLAVKRAYNRHRWLRPLLIACAWCRLWGVKFIIDTLHGSPLKRWRTNNSDTRGMSARHDLIDWVGGYPFEVAKPEQIFNFFLARGFELTDMTTQAGGIGCNEFAFRRRPEGDA